jgi:hypothetical protein
VEAQNPCPCIPSLPKEDHGRIPSDVTAAAALDFLAGAGEQRVPAAPYFRSEKETRRRRPDPCVSLPVTLSAAERPRPTRLFLGRPGALPVPGGEYAAGAEQLFFAWFLPRTEERRRVTGGRRGPCQSKRRRPRRCGDLTGLSPPANVIALPASDSFPPRFGSFISFFSLFFKAEKSLSFSVMRLAPSVQASGTHGTLVWLVVWRLGAVFPDLVG